MGLWKSWKGRRAGQYRKNCPRLGQQRILRGFGGIPPLWQGWSSAGARLRDRLEGCGAFLAKNSDKYSIDPTRVFVFGDSAGGQIAQMLLLTTPESLPGDKELAGVPYKMIAGVSWYGPCNFEKMELFSADPKKPARDRFGARICPPSTRPEDKLRLYQEVSPVNYLAKSSPPLLMAQGDSDSTIPVHHAYHMKEKADAIGAPVEIMIIENAGHNWREADPSKPISPSTAGIVEKSVNFLTGHLGASGR